MKLDCLPFMFTNNKRKEKKNLTSIQSNMKHKGVFIVRAYMFNQQFIYLARAVFGNPTFNSRVKFLKGFGIFLFPWELCPLVLDL